MSVDVLLWARVIHETFARDYRRSFRLPLLVPGMYVSKLLKLPEGCDPSRHRVEEIDYDSVTGLVNVYLDPDDFRKEKSGGEWTPQQVLEQFVDWEYVPEDRE